MFRIALAVLATTLALSGATLGQNAAGKDETAKPGPPSQRYRFSHTAEGVLRLDNETGQVMLCRALGGGWVCNPAPEETAVLQIELKRKDAEIQKLSGEFAQLKADLSRAEDAASEKQKALQADLARLQGEFAALKTDVASLNAQIVQAGKQPVTQEGKQAITQEERQGLVSRLALLEQDNSGLQGSLKRLEAENASLKKQVAETSARPDLQPAIIQVLEANDGIKRELAAAKEQLAALQKQMMTQDDRTAQQAEIAKLKAENAALNERIAVLQTDSAAMANEIAALKPPASSPTPPAAVPPDKKDELKLPSREDMERASAALADAWRRVKEMIEQLQKDLTGKTEPPVRL